MKIPDSLLESIRDRKIIPFVGAGLSASIQDREGGQLFPTWGALLLSAAKRLDGEGKANKANLVRSLVENDKLVEAAGEADQALGRRAWLSFLKETFDRVYSDADPSSLGLLFQVWTLGSNLVMTTNYDRSLQWSCPDQADFRVWDIEAKAELLGAIRDGQASRPTVWHLHGQIDNVSNLIIKKAEYDSLYGGTGKGNSTYKAALDTLRTLLKSHSFLFLGFSLKDEAFLKQVVSVNKTYKGAANQHYAILPPESASSANLEESGIHALHYDQHSDLSGILADLAVESLRSPPVNVPISRYIVDKKEGLYLFGGRGDAYFKLYDDALKAISSQLDIFSLKLSRFLRDHESTLLNAARHAKIRIALLDPKFPLPEGQGNLASIREREEKSEAGEIRRDVAKWASFYERYRERVVAGEIAESEKTGLDIRLYNILPTVNLFAVDESLFVGPYLLNVKDRETPTFLIRSDTAGKASMGNTMSDVYKRHFNAVWDDVETRSISTIEPEEIAAWKAGRSYGPLAP
ncbi:SIR2 family protein [Neorhizobium tomejilense]|uniref:SIR2 family protein n=1 Tax=Neorhizobium tomejilense TaxID=2093828 RepID=UPI00197C9A2A|nr:SIR2 family protein [Neorhizobium tomejilense]